MSITSVGYAGKITDANWRRLATATIGALYGVDDFESWRPTTGVGDRAVKIAIGGGFGLGVRDVSDAAVTLSLASVGSGSRWDLIVAHRDWDAKLTTFKVIQGSPTKALPSRDVGFGATNDQPIALVRVAAAQTVVQDIVDLRCIPGDGGVVAFDDLTRSYLDRVGTSVRIGDTVWDRIIDSIGSPAWASSGLTDTGWVDVVLGNGWAAASSAPQYQPKVRRIGSTVHLRGIIRNSALGDISNMCTVPAGFRPALDTTVGAYHSSNTGGHHGELMVSAGGVIQTGTGYYSGSLPVGSGIPLHGTWLVG